MIALLDLVCLLCTVGGLALICRAWVLRDFKEIEKAKGAPGFGRTWHRGRWLYKALYVGTLAFIFGAGPYALEVIGLRMAAFCFFSAWFWWLFFDRWLSLRRDLSVFYIGTSAGSDNLLRTIQERFKWNDQHTHNRVKLPGFVLSALILLITIYFSNF